MNQFEVRSPLGISCAGGEPWPSSSHDGGAGPWLSGAVEGGWGCVAWRTQWQLSSARVFNIYGNSQHGRSLPLFSQCPQLSLLALTSWVSIAIARRCKSGFILGLGWNKTLAVVAVWPANLPWLSSLKCFWGLTLFQYNQRSGPVRAPSFLLPPFGKHC